MNSFYTAEQVCLSGSNLTRSRRKYFIIHHRDMSRMNIFFSNCSSLQKSPSYKGTDCIGSYKSNYHTIMTTMVPFPIRNLGCGSHILIFDTRTVLDLQNMNLQITMMLSVKYCIFISYQFLYYLVSVSVLPK